MNKQQKKFSKAGKLCSKKNKPGSKAFGSCMHKKLRRKK